MQMCGCDRMVSTDSVPSGVLWMTQCQCLHRPLKLCGFSDSVLRFNDVKEHRIFITGCSVSMWATLYIGFCWERSIIWPVEFVNPWSCALFIHPSENISWMLSAHKYACDGLAVIATSSQKQSCSIYKASPPHPSFCILSCNQIWIENSF